MILFGNSQCIFFFLNLHFWVGDSVVDAESIREAEEILHFLWRHSLTSTTAAPHTTPAAGTSSCRGDAVSTGSNNSNNGAAQQLDTSSTNQPLAGNSKPNAPNIQLPPPPPVVILVANKIDLVRSRIISPQGRIDKPFRIVTIE